ncbi:MurR/RpiR family transcriptional regulator [Lacticigenium naphthae]|uniref:MurR/RpiR family transcriptional regulator n=1 Tax=Lacticigenium naphthae TaxID=515351 RepID=UPI0004185C9F|nr:MurR/RpiR family transcriptional regulator [Lacticigenium naphthae]
MGLLLMRLFAIVNTQPADTTDFHLARTLLEQYDNIKILTISELAEKCAVSKSTLSKFVRQIGFDDYQSMKEASGFEENRYDFHWNYLSNIVKPMQSKGPDFYFDAVLQDIERLRTQLDYEKIDRLAADLVHYKKVATFGLLFSQNAALDFQEKLAYNNKIIYTAIDDMVQEEYIRTADEDTLIIIFSNSGLYISQNQLSKAHLPKRTFNKTKAKIVLITSDPDKIEHEAVDYGIVFEHTTSVQTHALLYQLIMDLIVSRYRLLKKTD